MSIQDNWQKIKTVFREGRDDFAVALVVLLVGIGGFALGRISARGDSSTPIRIEYGDGVQSSDSSGNGIVQGAQTGPLGTSLPTAGEANRGSVMASKTGTKYYLPTCSGASRIKEENRVWFPSVEAARQAGYTPAANCPGL